MQKTQIFKAPLFKSLTFRTLPHTKAKLRVFFFFNVCSHPEEQSVNILQPFFNEFEILENTFPQSSSSDWHRQSSVNGLEQKCVTTVQYTHFLPPSFASINPMAHIHQDFLRPHCDRQVELC